MQAKQINILSCFFKDIKTLITGNDIIHKLEKVVHKMNEQHDRLEKLVSGIKLDLIVCNKIETEQNDTSKIINLNKQTYNNITL